MTQSIIVYRNPVEAALWEGQYGAYLVPIGGACLAALITFLFVHQVSEGILRKMGKRPYLFRDRISILSSFSATVAFILAINALWIS